MLIFSQIPKILRCFAPKVGKLSLWFFAKKRFLENVLFWIQTHWIIGEGTYGVVYKAQKGEELEHEPWIKFGPSLVAIKQQKAPVKQENSNNEPQTTQQLDTSFSVTLLREVKLLRELNHPNIVKLIDCMLEDGVTKLVFEFAEIEMMKLIDFYKSKQKPVPEPMIKSIMYQTLKGVKYLHENWVLHRDLKPDNILIIGGNSQRRGHVLLADLGLARLFRNPIKPLGQVDKVVVTLWYRAPELLLGSLNYTPAIDMWSIGCIFASLLLAETNSRALFQGANKEGMFQLDQLEKIFNILNYPDETNWPEAKTLPEYPKLTLNKPRSSNLPGGHLAAHFKQVSPNCLKLLTKLLELNPTQRLTASESLLNPYFSPKPNENAFEDVNNTCGQGSVLFQFEQHLQSQTCKALEYSVLKAQNDGIDAKKQQLREKHNQKRLRMSST